MKNLIRPLILLCFPTFFYAQSNCSHGEAYTELDFNNITAGLMHSGALWWDGSYGRYFAKPEAGEPEVQAIFASGLWLGGIHPDDAARVAATTYGLGFTGKTDFFPGPIRETTGNVEADDCTNWDKHFKILRSEVNFHLSDYAADNEVDSLNNAVYSWPAKDNPHFYDFNGFELPAGQDLAPFIDTNGDGIYNPSEGDYPDIKGDQAIWWVFNDIANEHTSTNGLPVKIEVQAMAYAYQSFEPTIDNTTFYDFKLKYYGEETLENFQTALWMDVDLGCYTDDRFGIDTTKNMAYYYNADFVDGDVFDLCPGGVETYGMEIPMLGVRLLEDSENLGVTSFICYQTTALGMPPPAEGYPTTVGEYYNYMTGLWRDGTSMFAGNSGYGSDSGDLTKYIFHGNPSEEVEWSMCSAAASNSNYFDRKTILSSGGTPLNPGYTRELTYAVIFVPDVPHPCPDLTEICAAADIVEAFEGVTSPIFTENVKSNLELRIAPNPTHERFLISLVNESTRIEKIEISDLSGKLLIEKDNLDATQYSMNLEGAVEGIYFIKVTTNKGNVGVGKVIFH